MKSLIEVFEFMEEYCVYTEILYLDDHSISGKFSTCAICDLTPEEREYFADALNLPVYGIDVEVGKLPVCYGVDMSAPGILTIYLGGDETYNVKQLIERLSMWRIRL